MFQSQQNYKTFLGEPVFGLKEQILDYDLLKEYLQVLLKDNDIRIKEATNRQGHFIQDHIAKTIFNACEKLKLPTSVKYLAVELYDKFMLQHMCDLFDHVRKSGSETEMSDWNAIKDRVRNQLVLRMISCCQVASKVTSHYQVVTLTKARNILNKLGMMYTVDSILQSELRVLKTLNYNVTIATPLTYIELFLSLLALREEDIPIKEVYSAGLKILDIFYIQRKDIYSCLYEMVHGSGDRPFSKRTKFIALENDFVLLAVGVIASALHVTYRCLAEKVVLHLSALAEVTVNDIIDFESAILQVFLKTREQ